MKFKRAPPVRNRKFSKLLVHGVSFSSVLVAMVMSDSMKNRSYKGWISHRTELGVRIPWSSCKVLPFTEEDAVRWIDHFAGGLSSFGDSYSKAGLPIRGADVSGWISRLQTTFPWMDDRTWKIRNMSLRLGLGPAILSGVIPHNDDLKLYQMSRIFILHSMASSGRLYFLGFPRTGQEFFEWRLAQGLSDHKTSVELSISANVLGLVDSTPSLPCSIELRRSISNYMGVSRADPSIPFPEKHDGIAAWRIKNRFTLDFLLYRIGIDYIPPYFDQRPWVLSDDIKQRLARAFPEVMTPPVTSASALTESLKLTDKGVPGAMDLGAPVLTPGRTKVIR